VYFLSTCNLPAFLCVYICYHSCMCRHVLLKKRVDDDDDDDDETMVSSGSTSLAVSGFECSAVCCLRPMPVRLQSCIRLGLLHDGQTAARTD